MWTTYEEPLVDGVYVWIYSMEPEFWETPGDMTIGVYAHELGHVFGLPDWYDYGGDSVGIGLWGLMAYGSWNGNLGDSPAHPCAEGRWRLGFVEPVVLTADVTGLAIPAVETNHENSVYYLWDEGAENNEYFLIVNRQQTGYDAAIPGNGLLIWHVDRDVYGNDRQCRDHDNCNCDGHYEVALEQADGLMELEYFYSGGDEGDPYPGSTDNRAFELETIPNSGSYADCYSCVSVTGISDSGPVMYADVTIECTPLFPDIKANGTDGPLTISSQDQLVVTVSLDAAGHSQNADWWLVCLSPFGWYYYSLTQNWNPGFSVTYQGPLLNIPQREVLDISGLPLGAYRFFFGIDTDMNGSIDTGLTYYDNVEVTVE
jgi:hypothetical protein